jgi:hypothetical protein
MPATQKPRNAIGPVQQHRRNPKQMTAIIPPSTVMSCQN